MAQDSQQTSPIAPTMAEAVGFNDRRVVADPRGAPEQGELVGKGHTKVSTDPSMGTANARGQGMETSNARFRVHPPTTMPNVPEAAATQANGRVISPTAAVHYEKDWDPSIEEGFDDAAVIGGVAPGASRLRGYTARQG